MSLLQAYIVGFSGRGVIIERVIDPAQAQVQLSFGTRRPNHYVSHEDEGYAYLPRNWIVV